MITIICLSTALILSIIINIACCIIIKSKLKIIDIYEGWVIIARNRCHDAYLKLKSIDDRQMFEKDDDVGVVFSDILKLTKELNEKIEDDEEEDAEEVGDSNETPI